MLACELGGEIDPSRNLASVLVVEAPAARSRGTVTRSSANKASGKPSFPTAQSATCTLVPRMCCQDAEYHHPGESLSFHSATGFFGEASGKNAKCKYLHPSSLPFSATAAKHSIFQDMHACLLSYNPDWLFFSLVISSSLKMQLILIHISLPPLMVQTLRGTWREWGHEVALAVCLQLHNQNQKSSLLCSSASSPPPALLQW